MSRKAQKRRSVHSSSMFGEVPDVLPDAHACEWPDCEAIGEHRAPHSRDDLKNFRWFCMGLCTLAYPKNDSLPFKCVLPLHFL